MVMAANKSQNKMPVYKEIGKVQENLGEGIILPCLAPSCKIMKYVYDVAWRRMRACVCGGGHACRAIVVARPSYATARAEQSATIKVRLG